MIERTYSNDTTVSIHLTHKCNMRCPHCYQKDYSGYNDVMDEEKVFSAVDKINPETIIIYGGEPMLFPKQVARIFDRYEKDKKVIIATNGTIWNKELYDRAYIIMTTVESFFFSFNKENRPYTKNQFDNLIKLLETYKDKILVTHNLYPKHNDPYFYKMQKLMGLSGQPYPIIDYCEDTDLDARTIMEYNVKMDQLIVPKLRVLPDGTITKDMRGVYNICKPEDWKPEYKDAEVPVHEKCKTCPYKERCPGYKMFPHFCKDVLDKIDEPHFCKTAKYLSSLEG